MKQIPNATYRLQFHSNLTFKHALNLVEYLNALGISHCYSSPILQAKPGSTHGYDIVNPGKINTELGSEEDFKEFVSALHQKQMGLILDIVPNHMFIFDPQNKWWQDILENGPASPYNIFFDIDWHPPKHIFDNKVLLPLLEQQYGEALEHQAIQIIYKDGAFLLKLSWIELPTDPKSWLMLLKPLSEESNKIIPEKTPCDELSSIVSSLNHLCTSTETNKEKIAERIREKEVIKKRLDILLKATPAMMALLQNQLTSFNGEKGNPNSFEILDAFMNAQNFRLCYWRVANDEINYRRFFDIFEYAGIRVENPEVFQTTHHLLESLCKKGLIDGLRIDHIDGLWDPEEYVNKIHSISKNHDEMYIVAEKIVMRDEKLRSEWPLHGTVGYDFLNQLNGIFIVPSHRKEFHTLYFKFTDSIYRGIDINYLCKKTVLNGSLASELNMLTRRLDRIAGGHRSSQDFTSESLKIALKEVIASFSVYRSYIRSDKGIIHLEDRQYILSAVAHAKRRNPLIHKAVFNFIQSVLLLEQPDKQNQLKSDRESFIMQFQQLTGPVMAKGVEDTAFYRFYPLVSINEVGGDINSFGIDVETFHKKNIEKLEFWPHSMLTTSTHDTKRSEDVRARINILSEIPIEWKKALRRWHKLNKQYKFKDGEEFFPDTNEEYLLYQILIGSWPIKAMDESELLQYTKRIQNYMEKAVKEAKVNSSWINPDQQHDQDVKEFVSHVLSKSKKNKFLIEFQEFTKKIIALGMLNSLSQVILKLTSPGVPDIYQGNELWDFSLVDPDNRRAVDFEWRKKALSELKRTPEGLLEYLSKPEDGLIKLFITERTLHLRKKEPQLFNAGIYVPLKVSGHLHHHVVAFARIAEEKVALVIVGRFFSSFMNSFSDCQNSEVWKETFLEIPIELTRFQFRNIFTEKLLVPEKDGRISMEQVMHMMPLAVLENV